MIADALKFLAEQAIRGVKPEPVVLDDPDRKVFLVNGDVLEVEVNPSPRRHTLGCLGDLIVLAKRFVEIEFPHADTDSETVARHEYLPVVWYDESRIVLVIDDDDHRAETATLKLELSDQFVRLRGLRDKPEWMDHKAFIRLLRIDFGRAIPATVLLDKVRKVKLEAGQVVNSSVGRNKESLGREIQASVSGQDEIPEHVLVSIPIYKTPGETDRYEFLCAVEIDPTLATPFRLTPMPDEIERVTQFAVSSIADRLVAGLPSSVPAYLGSP
jgi:hypothetical protein